MGSIPSEFEKDFQIDYYDEDFIEAEYFDRGLNEDVIIPNLIKNQGERFTQSVNSIILLYNVQYYSKGQNDLNNVKYIGSIRFI
ncbi:MULTISPECIES: immunity 22 family protein [Bacillus]|uniref:immunity 22 family protein n=1 Tax=Bacillus TaxID=1386 RepID=UPI00031F34ED|nr:MULTISPECIES: immunity 22 family protein [Bacillus]